MGGNTWKFDSSLQLSLFFLHLFFTEVVLMIVWMAYELFNDDQCDFQTHFRHKMNAVSYSMTQTSYRQLRGEEEVSGTLTSDKTKLDESLTSDNER